MINDMSVQNHLRILSGAGDLQRIAPATPTFDGIPIQGGSDNGLAGGGAVGGPSFGDMLISEIEKVNSEMVRSDQMVEDLATGKSTDVHGTLIQMKKAEIQFQMLVEVRNKMLKAYEEVMRMQA